MRLSGRGAYTAGERAEDAENKWTNDVEEDDGVHVDMGQRRGGVSKYGRVGTELAMG